MKIARKSSIFITCMALSIISFAATASLAATINASAGSNSLATGNALKDDTGGGGSISITLSPGVVMGFGADSTDGPGAGFAISAYNNKTKTAALDATGVEYGAASTYTGYYMLPTTSTTWTFVPPTVAAFTAANTAWKKAGGGS